MSRYNRTLYKLIQQKNLPVYLSSEDGKYWDVFSKDNDLLIFNDLQKESAIEFCKELGFNILAFIRIKDKKNYIE